MSQVLIDALQALRSDLERITTDAIVLHDNEFAGRGNSDLCDDIVTNALKAKEIFKIYESIIKEK